MGDNGEGGDCAAGPGDISIDDEAVEKHKMPTVKFFPGQSRQDMESSL